jgi:Family of unknown function (DUF6049)
VSRAARTLGCLLAVLGFAVATLPAQVLISPLTEPAYASEAESLTVSITSITPSTLIPGQPVQVAGSVTNSDTAPWTHLQVYLVLSPKPMTSATELDRALASDADALIGPRIISASPKQTWVEMGDLAPGATKSYQLEVAYRKLGISGSAGVYWLAVHVLATDPDGNRDATADARARTFIPLVPPTAGSAPLNLSLLWPLTEPVRSPRPGVFLDDTLGQSMSTDGRLNRLLHMTIGWQDKFSWIIDPAVLQAAKTMGRPYIVNDGIRTQQGQYSDDASTFLTDFRDQVGSSTQLSVPFGDPDVTALAHSGGGALLGAAGSAAGKVLHSTGLKTVPVSWPVGGRSTRGPVGAAARNGAEHALLSRSSLVDWPPGKTPLITMQTARSDVSAVVYSHDVFDSDPEPGDVDPTLQARQRLLAEAALLRLDPGASHSLVVAAPRGWDPGPGWFAAAFFEGLQTSWLHLTPASTLLGGTPESYDGPLRYPEQLRGRELSTVVTGGAKDLLHVATILASLHADAAAADDYDRSIALDVSLHWRSDPVTVSRIIDQQLRHVRHQLAGVSVESAQAVTLSSNNGRFPVTISNQLDRPVTVMLKARPADPALHLKVPDALVVGANERVQVHVDANSDRVGLTTVSVRLATADGHGFGRIKEIKVRTTQYGVVGWVIVAGGCAVVFGTSLRRLVRRVRSRRAAAEAEVETAPRSEVPS